MAAGLRVMCPETPWQPRETAIRARNAPARWLLESWGAEVSVHLMPGGPGEVLGTMARRNSLGLPQHKLPGFKEPLKSGTERRIQ